MKIIKNSYDCWAYKKYWACVIARAEDRQLRFVDKTKTFVDKLKANGSRINALYYAPIYFDLAEGQIIL